MKNQRLQRINSQIQKELAIIFQRFTQKSASKLIISVTEVKTSPDLSSAKVYLSIFPSEIEETVFKEVQQNHPLVMKQLGTQLAKNLRRIPKLSYFLDRTIDQAQEIEDLLKGKAENPLEK